MNKNVPFGGNEEQPSPQSHKIGLKKVSTQQSVLDSVPTKPTQEQFTQQVQRIQERDSSYKARAAQLVTEFNKAMSDKTLSQNKNMFQKEIEIELLRSMIRLAQEINENEKEREGEGSLSWITILLKHCFTQRDRINNLEFQLNEINKKLLELDKPKKSE